MVHPQKSNDMRLLIPFFFLLNLPFVVAQFSFGLTGGMSTSDLSGDAIHVAVNDSEQFRIQVNEARYGIHAGAFAIAQMDRFYIMPEVIFNSNKVEYHISDLDNTGEVVTILREEELQKLDLGLMMGMKLGALRLGIGPVGHVHLDNVSQLWDIEGYDQNFKGYDLGVSNRSWPGFMVHPYSM